MPRTSHLLIGGLEVPDESRGPHEVQTSNHCIFSVRVNKKISFAQRKCGILHHPRDRIEVSLGMWHERKQRVVYLFRGLRVHLRQGSETQVERGPFRELNFLVGRS